MKVLKFLVLRLSTSCAVTTNIFLRVTGTHTRDGIQMLLELLISQDDVIDELVV